MCQVLIMSGLNIPGFSICQVLNFQCYTGFNYFLTLDRFLSEFASGCLWNGSEYSSILSIPGFYICKH